MPWHVAQTQPMRDALARDQLRAQSFDVMMPTYQFRRINRGRMSYDARPLFQGYIFVFFDPHGADRWRWQKINSTRGVKRLLGGANVLTEAPASIDEQWASLIRWYCDGENDSMLTESSARDLVGKMVRVIAGPFAELVGRCEEIDLKRAAGWIVLSLLGRATRVPVAIDAMEVV